MIHSGQGLILGVEGVAGAGVTVPAFGGQARKLGKTAATMAFIRGNREKRGVGSVALHFRLVPSAVPFIYWLALLRSALRY